MTFEAFWNDYTSKPITDISDEVIDVFNTPFPEAVYEEYDLEEVITEFTGRHEDAKQFDKIAQFGRVLKQHHPQLYAEEHTYITDKLITYYCFRRDHEALAPVVQDFIIYPTTDFEQLEVVTKQLVYHGYLDLAENIIREKYEAAEQDEGLLSIGAAFEMGAIQYYRLLGEFCRRATEEGSLPDWSSFRQAAAKYEFRLEEKHREAITRGLTEEGSAHASRLRNNNRISSGNNQTRTVLTLEVMFLQEMRQYGMSFPVSGAIWSGIGGLWESNQATRWENYFHLTEATLRKFIMNRFGLFRDFRFDAALLLWGSPYVVDFLHDQGILTNEAYEQQAMAIEKVKQGFNNDFYFTLWEYSFIHHWQPSRSVSAESWQQEKEKFVRSFELKERDAASPIEDQYFYEPPVPPLPFFTDPEPVRVGPKIGRNDKVTVKYADGTIKENLKYKKVMDDLEAGRCELL